jgi:threo-3-hydroxy-L-aspartate ammonia-lyase
MRFYLQATDLVPEPSGAATLAAVLFHASELPAARRVAVVLSGGNVEPALEARLRFEVASMAR